MGSEKDGLWQTVKAPKSREAPNKGTQSSQESEPTATSSVFHALDVDYDRVTLMAVPSDLLCPLLPAYLQHILACAWHAPLSSSKVTRCSFQQQTRQRLASERSAAEASTSGRGYPTESSEDEGSITGAPEPVSASSAGPAKSKKPKVRSHRGPGAPSIVLAHQRPQLSVMPAVRLADAAQQPAHARLPAMGGLH